jgi:hypothetical protein
LHDPVQEAGILLAVLYKDSCILRIGHESGVEASQEILENINIGKSG